MKQILYLLPLFFCMCSSPDNNEGKASTFSMTLAPASTTVSIDEPFTVAVTSSETMKWIAVTADGSDPVNFSGSDFGTSKVLYFNFDTLGSRTINIKVKNEKNEVVLKTIAVTVTRGNAVKITALQLKSFHNINTTWDPEFSATDINRLPDVYFGFSKSRLSNFGSDAYTTNLWYRSLVKENQGDLIWDLTSANLYLNPSKVLLFGLTDKDGDLGQDLLMGPPDYKSIGFSSYQASKPNTITYSFPEINLEFIVTVEWP